MYSIDDFQFSSYFLSFFDIFYNKYFLIYSLRFVSLWRTINVPLRWSRTRYVMKSPLESEWMEQWAAMSLWHLILCSAQEQLPLFIQVTTFWLICHHIKFLTSKFVQASWPMARRWRLNLSMTPAYISIVNWIVLGKWVQQ